VATYQAIGSVAEAVRRLLEQAWPDQLGGLDPQFEVYNGQSFTEPMATGISIFVYQVGVDPVQRTLPAPAPDRKRPLPLNLWLLLTAWGNTPSAEHMLLGWAMRAIADNSSIPAGFLNAAVADVFSPEETVELVPAQLSNEEVFQLWQAMPISLQLSAPYLARLVRVQSEVRVPVGEPVHVRELALADGVQ